MAFINEYAKISTLWRGLLLTQPKTITVKLRHCEYHIISYYTSEDLKSGRLKRVPTRPDIMGLDLHTSLFDLASYRVPPKIQFGDLLWVKKASFSLFQRVDFDSTVVKARMNQFLLMRLLSSLHCPAGLPPTPIYLMKLCRSVPVHILPMHLKHTSNT